MGILSLGQWKSVNKDIMSCDCNSGDCKGPNFIDFSQFCQSTYDLLGLTTGDNYSLAQISGYFLSSASIGKLNNSIDTCYKILPIFSGSSVYFDTATQEWKNIDTNSGNANITGFIVCPPMGPSQLGIYQSQFTVDYYTTFGNQIMRSAGNFGQGSILQLKEADNSVSFVNRSTIAAQIRAFAKDARETLQDQIRDYLRFQVGAGSVVYSEDIGNFQPYWNVGYGFAGPYGYAGYWGFANYGGRGFYA